jgi:hypothetical protein
MKIKLHLSLAIVALCVLSMGCSSLMGTAANSTPGETLKDFYTALDRGDLTEADRLLAGRANGYKDSAALKNNTAQLATNIKAQGGIKSVDIQKEDSQEGMSEVGVKVNYKNGTSESVTYELLQEDRDWKVNRTK